MVFLLRPECVYSRAAAAFSDGYCEKERPESSLMGTETTNGSRDWMFSGQRFIFRSIPPSRNSGSRAGAQVPTRTRPAAAVHAGAGFPLHFTWKRLNSWRKIRHGEGEYVSAVSPTTPAGVGRFESWNADYPIHHVMLSMMEVNKHSFHKKTFPNPLQKNPNFLKR